MYIIVHVFFNDELFTNGRSFYDKERGRIFRRGHFTVKKIGFD